MKCQTNYNITAIIYDAIDYNGKPTTYLFCYGNSAELVDILNNGHTPDDWDGPKYPDAKFQPHNFRFYEQPAFIDY